MLQFYGTTYGGFYIENDMMQLENSIVFSFGIGEDLSFSEELIEKWNCEIYAFDPTPKSIIYVKNHKLRLNKKFHFFEYGISDLDGEMEFYLPMNEDYVSCSGHKHSGVKEDYISVKVMTFDSIIKDLGIDHIDILKMDIEGSEFEVFEKLDSKSFIFDQLCIEFHGRFFYDGEKKKETVFEKLYGEGYSIASATAETEEYTFVKKVTVL